MGMIVYRIAKSIQRAGDFSGIGAFKNGGRWNSKGTYMLYASMNSSLAYLETLVHFNEPDVPPNLYITAIEIKDSDSLICQVPDEEYHTTWQEQDNLENKIKGDRWMSEGKFLAFKVRSAINPSEFNFLLNPLFPGYHEKVIIHSVQQLNIDTRLIR
jgi:RES domain-containing protein